MKKFILLFLTACIFFVLTACGNSSGSDKKTLVMGTSADYPPFESKDGDKIVGFDVDLAKALAKKTGHDLEIKDMDFNGLITALKTNKVDIVLSGMTPTPDRKKQVDFSDVYYTAHNMIVTKKASGIKSLHDLKGKTIGVQLGSIQEEKAKELSADYDLNVENRNRISDLTEEIKAGRFDAAIIEDIVAQKYIDKNPELIGFNLPKEPDEKAGSAIAFKKNSELTEKFNKALQEMEKNGELEKLKKKWFSGEKK
ncbi:transporter substrate-binding domain-containing protein [Bacillus changyiensis]|uniref:transporter substrate-binding domain-containing protein n=1 Tax=Bacillus changyiensis TaxID=3004103 RepID=UPI0022E4CE45|nr:transporter substrate-binding domain-containing protein [Bacillus changyiensis]MDA1474924.1 transporter substrate-binding domain-containing protein [Bacillus changyiensis]